MEIIVYEMEYASENVSKTSIECIPFREEYFQEYMKIYNDCFFEMRKALDIQPYQVLNEYSQIENKAENIFLLIECGQIVGSVACYENEIDDLIVNPRFQHSGYGRKLLLWGMNRIRQRNSKPIILHAAQWNENAVALYKKVGFRVIKIERVR